MFEQPRLVGENNSQMDARACCTEGSSFETCVIVLCRRIYSARREREISSPLSRDTTHNHLKECAHKGTHSHSARSINLLNSCQVPPIFPSQRKCVASPRRRQFLEENIFVGDIYLLLFPPPTQSWLFHLLHTRWYPGFGDVWLYVCRQRRRRGRGSARHTAISSQSSGLLCGFYKQTFAHYSNNKYMKSQPICSSVFSYRKQLYNGVHREVVCLCRTWEYSGRVERNHQKTGNREILLEILYEPFYSRGIVYVYEFF